MSTPLVIAIDGPSGTGKSSVSKGLASELGLRYLDTGAMYRAVTWYMLSRGIDLTDSEAIGAALGGVELESGTDPLHPTIEVNGINVAEPIREADVTSAVSIVAAVPAVRAKLVQLQQRIVQQSDSRIVVEGRDIGTVVLPDANCKIFLTADPEARAARRANENGADVAATQQSLVTRDIADSTRAASPMAQADDAIEVDTTHMTLAEVIGHLKGLVGAQ